MIQILGDYKVWVWWVAEIAIKERKIALPTSRIKWYCNWLYLPVTTGQVQYAMREGVRRGKFTIIRDGRVNYYKLKR